MEIRIKILRCYNCGNETNHEMIFHQVSNILYDMFETEAGWNKANNNFHYYLFKCSTCTGLNIIGGFENEININSNKFQRLYPTGPNIRVELHKLDQAKQPVPEKLLKKYEEIWFLRMQVPNAFANQIRRCLEMICNDFHAKGKTLFSKLIDLKEKGLLPGENEELTRVIREVGNIGSHDSGQDLDIWDVELLDEFFKTIVDYLYIVPAKLKRLNTRLIVNNRK